MFPACWQLGPVSFHCCSCNTAYTRRECACCTKLRCVFYCVTSDCTAKVGFACNGKVQSLELWNSARIMHKLHLMEPSSSLSCLRVRRDVWQHLVFGLFQIRPATRDLHQSWAALSEQGIRSGASSGVCRGDGWPCCCWQLGLCGQRWW